MVRARAFGVVCLMALSSCVMAFDVESFRTGLMKQGKLYDAYTAKPQTQALFTEGRVSESNKQLMLLVPDNKKTAYDYFIIGNMLFQNDREASYQAMLKAEKMAPDNPFILFERGMHEHRLGRYGLAVEYYEQFTDSTFSKGSPLAKAYLTHVYLMTGQPEKAFNAWHDANFSKYHTSIEKGMYTIFSTTNQDRQRETLISEINQGATLKLCDLFQLDSHWEVDWWNYRPKTKYLEFDRQLAAKALNKDSLEAKYVDLCSLDSNTSDEVYVAKLREIRFLSEPLALPESSALVHEIVKRLIASKTLTADDVLKRYEKQLIVLSEKYPQDQKYYDVLAYLYANTGNKDKLKAIDWYGWKELNVEKYARSYIAGLEKGSDEYKTALDEALKDFPLSPSLNVQKLSVSEKNKKDVLLNLVAAQFTNVKNNWSGPYRLSDYMLSLKHELGKLDN